MSRAVFPLRMSQHLREAIRDRANLEDTTQTNLIRTAVRQYLTRPEQKLESTLVAFASADTDTAKSTAKVETVVENIFTISKTEIVRDS